MTKHPDQADAKRQRVGPYDHPSSSSPLPPGPRSSSSRPHPIPPAHHPPPPLHHHHPSASSPPAHHPSVPPSHHPPPLPPIHPSPPHQPQQHHHPAAGAQGPPPPSQPAPLDTSASPTSGRPSDPRPQSRHQQQRPYSSHSQLPMPVAHHAPDNSPDPSRYQHRAPPPGPPQGHYAYQHHNPHYSNEPVSARTPTTPSQPNSAVDPNARPAMYHDPYRHPAEAPQHSPYPPPGPPPNAQHHLAMHGGPDGRGYPYPPGAPQPMPVPPAGPQPPPFESYYAEVPGAPGEPKRKAVRASQACESCRQKKCKCDEERPICGNCQQNGTECQYRNLPPPKQERNMLEVTNQITAIASQITEMRNYFSAAFAGRPEMDGIRADLRDLREELRNAGIKRSPGHRDSPLRHDPDSPHPHEMVNGRAHHGGLPNGREGSVRSPSGALRPESASSRRPPHYRNMPPPSKSNMDDESIRRFDPLGGQLSIPMEHTTAAHKLLIAWDAIHPFYEGVIKKEEIRNYVWREETSRGQLRLFGQGEGHGMSAEHSPPSIGSVSGDAGVNDGTWGFGFDNTLEPPQETAGGLNPDGTLCLDPKVCQRLFDSFLNNIWVMHPFFNKVKLKSAFSSFLQRYCKEETDLSDVKFEAPQHKYRAMKRKRSDGGYEESEPSHTRASSLTESRRKPLERSINNAVILLILALGRIAEHRDPLPAPVKPEESSQMSTPNSRTSFTSHSRQNGHSADGPKSPRRHAAKVRNIDRMPGAAYYAYAAGILGEQQGAPDLAHVHARLLAGLFMGQLARVIDSWSWIHSACTGCKILFRDEKQLEEECPPERADAIRFAFWTCLQLESDILAELTELPHSGISRHEEVMPLPRWSTMNYSPDAQEQAIMTYYLAQIHLRKILNRAHSALYNSGKDSLKNPGWTIFTAEDLALQLSDWKNSLPPGFGWQDDDEPAASINDARLRAKYYGAQYMIHRPFLHHLLQDELAKPAPPEISKLIQLKNSEKEGVVTMARKCIEAAVRSTYAFDGLTGRPIVTGIFGTAHAQFGNVLVLAACSTSAKYRWFTNRVDMEALIQRTIEFVSVLAPHAPTMKTNLSILYNTREMLRNGYRSERIDTHESHMTDAGRSFGSEEQDRMHTA